MLPRIVRLILGAGRNPRQVGQGLPDPVVRPEGVRTGASQAERNKALGRKVPPRPPKTLKE